MTRSMIRLILFAALAASPVLAQAPMPGMQHGTPAAPGAMPGMLTGISQGLPMSAGRMEMTRQMEAMDKAMMGTPMTGNPDQDFVAMMMPHHQGAIDMARIYLRDGKDPEIRQTAEKIIADQEREIGEFKAWQAKHPAP